MRKTANCPRRGIITHNRYLTRRFFFPDRENSQMLITCK